MPSIGLRLLLAAAGTAFGLLLVEGICRFGVEDGRRSPATLWGSPLVPKDALDLRAAGEAEEQSGYVRVDPVLGWTLSPGASAEETAVYQADAAGLRTLPGGESHRRDPSALRIAAFGDSFTHCDEVGLEDCWTQRVEVETGSRVFNAGVPGYGTDQAYLRYLELREKLAPDIVILGLMIGDMKRNVNVFRTFLAEWTAWSKPRFVLAGDGIVLVNQPAAPPSEVPDMIASGHPLVDLDWWYDPMEWRHGPLARSVAYRFALGRVWKRQGRERPDFYERESEPTQITARIVAAFARDVEARGGRFLCLMIPSRPDLRFSDPVPWQPLMSLMNEAGIEVVDPTVALREVADDPGLFEPKGHYSRLGNEILAKFVARALARDPVRIGGAEDGLRKGGVKGSAEKDTIGVFDPKTRTFFLSNANSVGPPAVVEIFGPPGSIAAMGDFDGNGTDTFGVYSGDTGEFLQRDLNSGGPAARRFRFGGTAPGRRPVIGNWDGLEGDSIGVYDPARGRFFLRNSNTSGPPDVVTRFGPRGSAGELVPIAGNWSGGDGIDGIGLYAPASGQFFLRDDPTTDGAPDFDFGFGPVGAALIPLVGDWDGNGADDVGLYDPAERSFFLRSTHSDGPAHRAFRFGTKDLAPVAGNFDGS